MGQETRQTFLVPFWHIKEQWGHAVEFELRDGLRGPSSSFFTSNEGGILELKLHYDDPSAWSIFLRWVVHPEHQFPESTVQDPILLVRCWFMGGKRYFNEFRDDAMIALIRYFDKFDSDVNNSGTSRYNKSVSMELIRYAYCNHGPGTSKLLQLIAEEIVKSELFHKCSFDKMPHDSDACARCRRDRANVEKELRCQRPANDPHSHGCALQLQLWKDILSAKQEYYGQVGGGDLVHRLEKDREGKRPVYMKFLVGTKWVDIRSMFVGGQSQRRFGLW